MFGSKMLDVAVGLVFLFLVVSVICSALREAIEAWFKTRAAYLERGIRELLNDRYARDRHEAYRASLAAHDAKAAATGAGAPSEPPPRPTGLADAFFEHPMIASLYTAPAYVPGEARARPRLLARGRDLPSYIPTRNFAVALMDIAARGPVTDVVSSGPSAPPMTLESVRANVLNLGNPAVQRVMLTAIDGAGGDLERARKAIEAWYDSGMDRVSGWYKRSTSWVLFWIGLFVAVALNVDTLRVASFLADNDAARAAIVARAERAVRDSAVLTASYAQARRELDSLGVPIGWTRAPLRRDASSAIGVRLDEAVSGTAIPGWLLTALAATFGAPFWFDLLNKFMVIRSTVKPHEKSVEESSEDRQRPEEKTDATSAATPTTGTPTSTATPTSPPSPLAPRGSAPPVQAPRDATSGVDGCAVDMTGAGATQTADEDLPAAEGGVAA